MCEKNKEVSEWLKVVLEETQVAWFEVNMRTVDVLYKLSKDSEQRGREIGRLVEDIKQKTGECKADGAYHQKVLHSALGEDASSEILKPMSRCLNSLECMAIGFKMKDTKLASFLATTNNETKVLLEEEQENRELQKKMRNLEEKRTEVLNSQKCLLKNISKLQKAQEVEFMETEERLLNKNFMENKYQEMSSRVRSAEEKLASRDVAWSLTHHCIQEISEQLSVLKQEMDPLKRKLQAYYGLPPSLPLARLAVAESKMELGALDAILDEKIDWRHT
ncbi:HAUS augmin-like complex subunit 1 [Clupea harengus]|uniref:HAUS augmin-like complex subunit 1 n=1 Tax=Clupea harengus TaxID=7950 RepID=A0A6P3WA52_CLUHA|nr:HAUS augmin-like complex subunit 1 [Clupea harengus]